MEVTPEMRYFAVARMTRQLEKMAESNDILKLGDPELDRLSEEICEAARKMRDHCFDILDQK